MPSHLSLYLQELRATRATGANTPETSFYPALKALFDAVGATLEPKVLCIMNLRNRGAGLPDGGLFTADQYQRRGGPGDGTFPTAMPSRGAIEVKPVQHDLDRLIRSNQAVTYGGTYQRVLVTNLRAFAYVEYRADGPHVVERFALAEDEAQFWTLCRSPNRANEKEARFTAFLERVLKTPAKITTPEDLAWFLASYAREALLDVEKAPISGFTDVAAALEQALGVGFGFAADSLRSEAERIRARHFFRSVLIQTLFYGVFSAWVIWSGDGRRPGARFVWRETSDLLRISVLGVLFHAMTAPGQQQLFSTQLRHWLELAESALDRVDHAAFFAKFEQQDAVQYFYEPFLEAFDPELRRELGVWYTPPEVVHYMVERVDRALREDLGIPDGLASNEVIVLDPCCGTGAFLIAVLDRIRRTWEERGEGGLAAEEVVRAACDRIVGFEILPAPFVIAHLQIGLALQRLGVRLPEDKRAAVYLTNALTGWDPAAGVQPLLWPGLREERDAADRVKRRMKVLVVLGNPPYNAFAGVQPADERDSVQVYKEGLVKDWGIRKFNLDELYVRFLRLAERKIVEHTGRGVVCFISNASYLGDKSFVVLRQRFASEFDSIQIDNLNGDSRETGKLTPEGAPDPSVFSTPRNPEGIQVGTAIGLFTRAGRRRGARAERNARVRWRDFWGHRKAEQLLTSLSTELDYIEVQPDPQSMWAFRPYAQAADYRSWLRLQALAAMPPISGLAEKRKGGLLSLLQHDLEARMKAYFDLNQSWEDIGGLIGGLADDAARYPAAETRRKLLAAGEVFVEDRVRRYALFPLDVRWCYQTGARPLWNEPRPDLVAQAWEGNRFVVFRSQARRPDEGIPVTVTSALPDHHLLDPNVLAIPMRWRDVHLGVARTRANLSETARAWLAALGFLDADLPEVAELPWFYALAIAHSPVWLDENGAAIRADFPRMPLPADREVLLRAAKLGERLADLLDPERPVAGVTSGVVPEPLRSLGVLRRLDGHPLRREEGDFTVSARWGALQRGSVVMPGPGRTTPSDATGRPELGVGAIDVWLNERVVLAMVPEPVWAFTVGGYQVVKKWLSYRERAVLGRDLTLEEARHLTAMVRRLAAILALAPELDAVYRAARELPWSPDDNQ